MFRSIFGSKCVIVILHLICSPGPNVLFNPYGLWHLIQISVGTVAVVDANNSTSDTSVGISWQQPKITSECPHNLGKFYTCFFLHSAVI